MPRLTTRLYTDVQAAIVAQAFAFLNGGKPATAVQVSEWLDRQIRAQVLAYYSRIEGTKADKAARLATSALET